MEEQEWPARSGKVRGKIELCFNTLIYLDVFISTYVQKCCQHGNIGQSNLTAETQWRSLRFDTRIITSNSSKWLYSHSKMSKETSRVLLFWQKVHFPIEHVIKRILYTLMSLTVSHYYCYSGAACVKAAWINLVSCQKPASGRDHAPLAPTSWHMQLHPVQRRSRSGAGSGVSRLRVWPRVH